MAIQENEQAYMSLVDLKGVTTVILLDISESMAENNGWQQAMTFVADFLQGLKEQKQSYSVPETVALVTFRHQTRCLQGLTTDYDLLLGTIDPSMIIRHNEISINAKVVLITDGHVTETCVHSGPDVCDPASIDEITKVLLHEVDHLRIGEGVTKNLDIVPVGKPILTKILPRDPLEILRGGYMCRIPRNDIDITTEDRAQMLEIIERSELVRQKLPIYNELDDTFPILGTRVRRGPDWPLMNELDGKGVGTIVGHDINMKGLFVHWDCADLPNWYSYGFKGKCSVFPVEEPRVLPLGRPPNVGCVVEPGPDFDDTANASHGDRGVILAIQTKDHIHKVAVRWLNKNRGLYSYGEDGIFEVKLSNDQSWPGQRDQVSSSSAPSGTVGQPATEPKTPKVKNRNL